MTQTPIPGEEIELFKQLGKMNVIFDVGARTDTDYLELWPEAQHHLFEPNPEFFKELSEKVGERPNVFLNNFGLGDREEERGYQHGRQSFAGSWILGDRDPTDITLYLRTLSQYAKDKGITQIDFLKIDTEGFELKILLGAIHYLDKIRFIQYEHWGPQHYKVIKGLLQDDYWLEDIGYRNVLCVNKKLVSKPEYQRIKRYIKRNKLAQLV